MEAFLISTSSLLLAEFGDKTQLLALVLAARFRRPVTVMAAVLIATVGLNLMAVAVGSLIGDLAGPAVMRWGLGISFLLGAGWALQTEDEPTEVDDTGSRYGAFATTFIAFSLAELGDKTQFATAALAMKFDGWVTVAIGSTLGMSLAILPAVLFGHRICKLVPLKLVRWGAALVFASVGIATLAGWL